MISVPPVLFTCTQRGSAKATYSLRVGGWNAFLAGHFNTALQLVVHSSG